MMTSGAFETISGGFEVGKYFAETLFQRRKQGLGQNLTTNEIAHWKRIQRIAADCDQNALQFAISIPDRSKQFPIERVKSYTVGLDATRTLQYYANRTSDVPLTNLTLAQRTLIQQWRADALVIYTRSACRMKTGDLFASIPADVDPVGAAEILYVAEYSSGDAAKLIAKVDDDLSINTVFVEVSKRWAPYFPTSKGYTQLALKTVRSDQVNLAYFVRPPFSTNIDLIPPAPTDPTTEVPYPPSDFTPVVGRPVLKSAIFDGEYEGTTDAEKRIGFEADLNTILHLPPNSELDENDRQQIELMHGHMVEFAKAGGLKHPQRWYNLGQAEAILLPRGIMSTSTGKQWYDTQIKNNNTPEAQNLRSYAEGFGMAGVEMAKISGLGTTFNVDVIRMNAMSSVSELKDITLRDQASIDALCERMKELRLVAWPKRRLDIQRQMTVLLKNYNEGKVSVEEKKQINDLNAQQKALLKERAELEAAYQAVLQRSKSQPGVNAAKVVKCLDESRDAEQQRLREEVFTTTPVDVSATAVATTKPNWVGGDVMSFV